MFCDACGMAIQADQKFCGRCGKSMTGGVQFLQPRRSRVQGHIRLLGILWLAVSALTLLGGGVLTIVANTIFAQGGINLAHAPAFLQPLLSIIGIVISGVALIGFLTGWGLLHHEPWARLAALVLGFIVLFHPILGTALGIYTLWVLLPSESEEEYKSLAQAA